MKISSICGASCGTGPVLLVLTLLFLAQTRAVLGQVPVDPPNPQHQAPPSGPPSEFRASEKSLARPESASGSLFYSIGQPTDEEQLYLEYINRSRANPAAEGTRLAATTDPKVLSAYSYFSLNLALMQSQFNAIPAVPPLAMNSKLTAAARVHSQDMFTNQYQAHNGKDGLTPGDRITAQGYVWAGYGENIYAYSESTYFGYAGLNVDWGNGTGGMQTPAGHRENIHSSTYREAGIGVIDGTNGSVGPQIVTQDLGVQQSSSPFITGVVYYDLAGTQFYDVGEGIGGVSVTVDGVSYYSVTADSGGYAVPVPGDGSYTVIFSTSGLVSTQKVSVVSSKNVKLDLAQPYSPPVISGPNPAGINQNNNYYFTPVAGATSYQWQVTRLVSYTTVEGGENGLGGVTIGSSPGYLVLTNGSAASGTHSFHLAQPTPPTAQTITLKAILRPQATSQLTFDKMLGYATTNQVAHVQVSTNGGAAWRNVWTQAGTNGPGESSFTHVKVSLAPYAGLLLQVRFLYDYSGGSYYPQTNKNAGWIIDNIAVTPAQQALSPVVNDISSGISFSLNPSSQDAYLLSVRALIKSRTLNWGPAFAITTAVLPSIQLSSKPVISSGQIKIDFTVTNYRTGMTFQLWKAPDPSGPWTLDSTATTTTLVTGSKFQEKTAIGSAAWTYYRVLGV